LAETILRLYRLALGNCALNWCSCWRQREGADALDGMGLLINNFNAEQRRIMAEMHQEIQLLISLFIISVLLFQCMQSVFKASFLHCTLGVY
jgi:hypothetical protein